MQAWTSSKTGTGEPVAGSPPTATRDPGDTPTPPPKRITLKGLTVVAASVASDVPTPSEATPPAQAPWADFMEETPGPVAAPVAAAQVNVPPAAAAVTPAVVAQTAVAPTVAVAPAVVVAPAATAPAVVIQGGRVPVASRPTPAQPQAAPVAGDDPSFSDQVLRWMQQGDRLAERPRAPIDLSDLAEPTDPVAHELLEGPLGKPRTSKAQVRRRWMGVSAFVVMSAIGIYWAAQGHGPSGDRPALGGAIPIAASASPIVRPIPALIPPGAGVPGSPPLAAADPTPKAAKAKPAAANTKLAARDSRGHRRAAVVRPHRHR